MSLQKEFKQDIALAEIPVSGCTVLVKSVDQWHTLLKNLVEVARICLNSLLLSFLVSFSSL